jgi:hypothetical protein
MLLMAHLFDQLEAVSVQLLLQGQLLHLAQFLPIFEALLKDQFRTWIRFEQLYDLVGL